MVLSGRVGLTEVTVVGGFDLCGGGVVELVAEPLGLLRVQLTVVVCDRAA